MSNRKLNVYVFGAGASSHAKAPLATELLKAGFDLICEAEPSQISIESRRTVAALLDTLYGSKLVSKIEEAIQNRYLYLLDPKFPSVTIEELLSFVDIGISNNETWLPYKELQQALYDFVFETIEQSTFFSFGGHLASNADGTLNRDRNCYHKLVDYLIDLNGQNCFISFNYDVLLDEAVSINDHRIIGDYNLDFTDVENYNDYWKVIKGQRSPNDIDILKLHGSMNWGRCVNCKKFYLAFYKKYNAYKSKTCKICNSHLSQVLVPPTYRKRIEEYGISCLWDKASDSLSNADHITIIGYSFPDADIEAKWLFKRSLAQGGKRPNLTLVEPQLEVRKKIAKIFGNTVGEMSCFNTFEDYCERKQLKDCS